MVNKAVLTLLGVMLFAYLFGQGQRNYSDLINEAQKSYQNKEFLKAGQKYTEAFNSSNKIISVGDRINAASAWSQANLPDSAFLQLFKLVQDSSFIYYNNLIINSELTTLNSDKRWNKVIKHAKDNLVRIEGNLDLNLVAMLDSIFQDDQKCRLNFRVYLQKYGGNSKEFASLRNNMHKVDSINLIKTKKFIDTYGWLSPKIIGSQGSGTLWMVLQHSDRKTREEYFPMIKDAAKKGYLDQGRVALMEDRMALEQGKKQIYGSQLSQDQITGEYYIEPLIDPVNVDKRRADVGLEKLQDYVSRYGIIWNVEEYKKKLPAIEIKYGEKK